MSSLNRITLKQLYNLLDVYKDSYGEMELITIGTSSDLEYFFVVGDENGKWTKLPIPQYKDKYSTKLNSYINMKFED